MLRLVVPMDTKLLQGSVLGVAGQRLRAVLHRKPWPLRTSSGSGGNRPKVRSQLGRRYVGGWRGSRYCPLAMIAKAQVPRSVRGSTSPKLCAACRSENLADAPFCQGCGVLLGSLDCPKCDHTNQNYAHHCRACGHSFRECADICESVAPPALAARASAGGLSPTTLIGFGAVLSLAAAVYPWYLFGAHGAALSQQASIFQLLAEGWAGFPGIPLMAIVVAAVTASAVSSIWPPVAVVSGFVTLLSGVWLGTGPGGDPAALTTGAVLAMVGAIVVMAGGLYVWNVQRTKTRMDRTNGFGRARLARLAS